MNNSSTRAKTTRNNVVHQLFDLQLGLGKRSVQRLRGQILKTILCSPQREFTEVTRFGTRGPSMFTLLHCGRLLIHQTGSVKCYSAFKRDNNPLISTNKLKPLYKFPLTETCRDLVVWSPDSPHCTRQLLRQNARHSTSFLYVTNLHYLKRRCALTGKLFETIYLGKRSFTEIHCDPESDLIILKSVRETKDDEFLTFVVFTSPPLQFLAKFELKKSVFGSKAVDAGIQQGVLFIRYSDERINLFSFEYILNEFTEQQFKLGDTLQDGSVLGEKPSELPYTMQINSLPPVLLSATSAQGSFIVGGNPWHSIIKPQVQTCQVRRLGEDRIVTSIETPNADDETEHVFFHPDESNRLVHMSTDFIKIFWIKTDSLQLWLKHSMEEETASNLRQSYLSRFGRRIARRSVDQYQLSTSKDLCLTYDIETDLLAALHIREGPEVNHHTLVKVVLFDNVSGTVVRTVDLEMIPVPAPFDTSSFHLVLDGLHIFVLSRCQNRTHGILYTLSETIAHKSRKEKP